MPIFRLIWAASVRTHGILSYAPTNLLIAATRTRRGPKWGALVMLLAVPYLIVAAALRDLIDGGGPGWLNLVVLMCIWNAMKLALMMTHLAQPQTFRLPGRTVTTDRIRFHADDATGMMNTIRPLLAPDSPGPGGSPATSP